MPYNVKYIVTERDSMKKINRKTAFTLAEVLITLGIIGVVAVITMPVLINNVQDRVRQKRVENIKQKLSNATDLMAVNSGLNGYSDTMSFVQELSKYLKILKICDNSKLESCWPTKEVSLNKENKVWEISKTKSAKTLRIPEKVRKNYSDTVAIVTADGTAMILTYDKTCNFNQDVNGYVYNDGLSNSLGCLAGVFDWNGAKNPNKLGNDVLPIGVALGLGLDCAFETNGKCFSSPFTPIPISKADCEEQKDKLGIIKGCVSNPDYWAGAVAKCGGVSNMPNANDLLLLGQEIYGTQINHYGDNSGVTINTSKISSLGFKGVPFGVWSNDEGDAGFSYYREFGAKSTKWQGYGKHGSHLFAVCMDGN